MAKKIKHITRVALMALMAALLITALPGCKANKCDCPTFGGHRLKH